MIRFSLIYLSVFFFLISLFSFFNIIYSYYFNLYLNVDSYIYTLVLSLIFGFLFIFNKKKENKFNIYQKIITVIIGYFFLPIIISLPYYFGIYNITFLNSYFEAISGFTSTGFTVFNNIKHLDQSLILWRSSSQWIGGVYFLFSIILLMDIFDNTLKKSLTNFISFNTSEVLKQSFKILIFYSILTLFIFIVLNITGVRIFDSFNLSFTIISSGGFIPTNNIELIINSDFKKIVFSLLMLISFFSLFFSYNLLFFKKKNLTFFIEDVYLFFYFIFLLVIFFIFFNFDYNFSSILFSITSSISNIGISTNDVSPNLYFIFLILVIIGGSFFSTSSGIRFLKIFSLVKFSFNELLSHSKPKHIYINKFIFSESNIVHVDIYKYFLSVLIFILSLFILTSFLTISNVSIDDAFKLAILTLMNTVNSSMYSLSDLNFLTMNYFSKISLIIFMIIGRVELLTILIISKKFLFKN